MSKDVLKLIRKVTPETPGKVRPNSSGKVRMNPADRKLLKSVIEKNIICNQCGGNITVELPSSNMTCNDCGAIQ